MAGPLSDLTVLDLSRVLAGPWCTQLLADLGATVIKVERPHSGDDTRAWGPPYLRDAQSRETSEAAYYLCCNRGKLSVAIDFTTPDGQRLVRELAQGADILVENYKVGGLAKYGLDYASLAPANPRLVYCSITGFGQNGPYADRAGYDFIVQGMSGFMSVTGERDDRPGGGPQKAGVAISDLMTGMYATVAIQAALAHRERTGAGQWIDCCLFDSAVAMMATMSHNYLVTGIPPARIGNAHQNIVPYEVFACADGHLILAVGNDAQFAKFCAVASHPGVERRPALREERRPRAPSRGAGAAHCGGGARTPAAGLARRAGTARRAVRSDQPDGPGVRRSADRGARAQARPAASARGHGAAGARAARLLGDAALIRPAAAVVGRAYRLRVTRAAGARTGRYRGARAAQRDTNTMMIVHYLYHVPWPPSR